jgi:TonB-dependent siderophore receptor
VTTVRLLSRCLFLGAFLFAPVPYAAAQEPAAAAEDPAAPATAPALPAYEEVLFVEALPEVPASNTLTTKLPLSLLQTPASVGVVSESLIEEQAAQVLGDALSNVSGLSPQTQSGIADLFVVRGFDSVSSGLVLTDGAVEPEVSFYQLYNVERIEVLKGPGGFLYGATPTAGTVNLVRKQPAAGRFLSLDLDAGSFGTYGGELDVNAGSEDLSFRLNGLYRQSDGFRDRSESEVTAVNPAFTWRPGGSDRSRVNVNVELVDASYTPDAGLPIVNGLFTGGATAIAEVPRERSYGSPFDVSDQQLNRVQVDFEHTFSDRFVLRDKLYYRDLDWQSDGTILAGVFPDFTTGSLVAARVLTSLDDRQRLTGNQLEGVFTFSGSGGVEHRLLAGLEVGRFTDEFTIDTFLLPSLDIRNPVETAQRPLFPLPGQGLAADAETRILAPYLIDQIRFSDRFQVTLGGRFDSLDYEDPVSGTERDDSKFSPLVGLVFSPSPNVSLYASGTQAFAPPSSRTVGERRPEESDQIEVGVKSRLLDGRLETAVALYQLERENVAIPDDNGVTQQTGSQRSRGLELDLSARLAPRTRALFSYAYTDAELTKFAELVQVAIQPFPVFLTFDRSGNAPAFAPEHLARLWVSHGFGGGFGLAAGARYVGEQFVAEDNAFALDDALLLDAAISWDRGPQRFSLNFKNLADEEYETRGFGGSSVIPAPGFSVVGSVGFRAGW